MACSNSESVAGAVRMTFRPGDMTIVDVETTLFPRVNLEHVGLGGMGGTYLFGPNDRRNVDDARPSVYEVSGLQMLAGHGEWLWRPLRNPDTLQTFRFPRPEPARLRPSPARSRLRRLPGRRSALRGPPERLDRTDRRVGRGAVQLIEIPSDSEVNDNVLAYWRPKDADGSRLGGVARLPPVLVLDAAGAPAPGERRHVAGGARFDRPQAPFFRSTLRVTCSATAPSRNSNLPSRRALEPSTG